MVRQLEAHGHLEFWQKFVDNFLVEKKLYGDGSLFFRSSMRKLLKFATKTPGKVALPANFQSKTFKSDVHVRQKIRTAIPSSYMPNHFAPISEGSLVAVFMPEERCNVLGLEGFSDYESLVAKVLVVRDGDVYKCVWMESQPVRVPVLADGMS